MIAWGYWDIKARISINPYNVTPVLCTVRISLKHCLTQKLHFVLPLFLLLMLAFFFTSECIYCTTFLF